jgi:hypothetical protein
MDTETSAAIERLLEIAGNDTGQSRRVADFLLAWWNAETCGGFDLTDAWCCDDAIAQDMVRIFTFVAHHRHYPDTLGFGPWFEKIVQQWRPQLVQ